jgi:hypothetical protein
LRAHLKWLIALSLECSQASRCAMIKFRNLDQKTGKSTAVVGCR